VDSTTSSLLELLNLNGSGVALIPTPKEYMMATSNGNGTHNSNGAGLRLKTGLAEMLKGGVIMDVMSVAQARIAEEAGAVAVMALERVPP